MFVLIFFEESGINEIELKTTKACKLQINMYSLSTSRLALL